MLHSARATLTGSADETTANARKEEISVRGTRDIIYEGIVGRGVWGEPGIC